MSPAKGPVDKELLPLPQHISGALESRVETEAGLLPGTRQSGQGTEWLATAAICALTRGGGDTQ